jgi:hypothetical protein
MPRKASHTLRFEGPFAAGTDRNLANKWPAELGCGVTVANGPEYPTNFSSSVNLNNPSPGFDSGHLGLWAYGDGSTFEFPTPVSYVSFQISPQASVHQGDFELVAKQEGAGKDQVIQFSPVADRSNVSNVEMKIDPPATKITIRLANNGSNSLLLMDNLKFVTQSPYTCESDEPSF